MSFKKFFLLFGVAFAIATSIVKQASAGTHHISYYINTAGKDANPGTKNKPFRSIDKVNSLHLVAGDTVYFKAGQTFNGGLKLKTGTNGTKDKPVVITAYGIDNAMIDSKDSVAINVYKSSYIKFE